MKAKKFVAIVTAIALIVLPTQAAFAADIIEGDAIVNYVDPASITITVVPTSESLAFTLDPQNLAAIHGVGAWDPEAGGSIIPAAVNIVTNKSAVPMKTTVTFTLTDDQEDVVLLNSLAGVNDGTDKNMYMSFVPADAKTTIAQAAIPASSTPVFVMNGENPVEFDEDVLIAAGVASEDLLAHDAENPGFGKFVETEADSGKFNQVEVPTHALIPATLQTTVSAYTGVSAAAAVLEDAEVGTSLAYVMNKADYYVVNSGNGYELKYDGEARNNNYDTASFLISGIINKNADWSGYDSETKISLTATYSFELLTKAEYDAAIGGKVEDTYNSVETVPPVAPSITENTAEIEADTAEEFTVSLGTGSLAVSGITSVTYEDDGTQTLEAGADKDYTFSGTTLTFTAAYVNSLIAGEVESRAHTVTFTNSASTTATATLTYTIPAPNAAPSIAVTSYTIQDNTALPITVNLGAGELAATGISSITYVNSQGNTQTLPTTDYTFEGTTLTFKASYISVLFPALSGSRNYNIRFNDAANTTVVVALSK